MAKESTKPGPDGLDRYRDKRDPTRTNEPFAPAPAGAGSPPETRQGSFVVHLHAATRRHYDLRIEIGGVLESFAVPKGPSLDPADKRLAVQTEPHPLAYVDFEDVIPEGNYGAGSMIAWDLGRIGYLERDAAEGLAKGELDFELAGHKLRGRFKLVRTSGRGNRRAQGDKPQWLLLKRSDAHARPGFDVVAEMPRSVLSGLTVEELPRAAEIAAALERDAAAAGATEGEVSARRLTPMLCATSGAELAQPGWAYELKLDGVRIVADKRGDDVALYYRTRRAATAQFPEVVSAVRALPVERAVLDGEVVTFDETGRPSFQRLGRRLHASRPADIRFAARSVPVSYLVFDLLALGALDLRDLPLSVRKELLSRLVRGRGTARALDHLTGDGAPLYALCRQNRLEGVVAKRLDAPYTHGPKRSGDWVKIKCERDDDFVVYGFTRSRSDPTRIGALAIAAYEGDALIARGRVGSGLDEATLQALEARFAEMTLPDGDVGGPEPRKDVTFVRPDIVVRVRYLGWSDDGNLRHPVFLGVRDDVAPRSCTVIPRAADDAVLAISAGSKRGKEGTRTAGRRRIALTNQGKVFWPDSGYTKGDLCDYYEAIADTIVPYLTDRPVVLVRYPDGIEGKSFYQWRLPPGAPSWLRCVPHRTEEDDGKEKNTFLVNDLDSLLYIANLGCIPMHVIAARAEHLEQADFLTIDFDIGRSRFEHVVTLARELRAVLDDIGLPGYPKTSGQTGLHVLVPLGPGVTFETAKVLCELLGRIVERRHPALATMERIKPKRGDKVLVDVGQTGRSRTIVAPYSVRATPGARVSTPLSWEEVGLALDPAHHHILSVPARVERQGDPMAPLLRASPDVPAAVAALGALLG